VGFVPFYSVLFDRAEDRQRIDEDREAPEYFADLYLDQVIASLVTGRNEYRLPPFLSTPLTRADAIRYRHEVFQDLQNDRVRACVRAFAARMHQMRQELEQAGKLRYDLQQRRWFVDAADTYGDVVRQLADDLDQVAVSSAGLRGLRDYLSSYARSAGFARLRADTERVKQALDSVHYAMTIRPGSVRVARYEGEPDYSAEVTTTFEKFRQGAVKDYRARLANWAEMDHVEATVLDLVAKLHPEPFQLLRHFHIQHRDFLDATIAAFDREVQFYRAYLEHMDRLALPFCYPEVSGDSKELDVAGTYDLALADKLVPEKTPVVRNDFHLTGPERVIVVTGPNQGGKSTFARTFGQLHHLAAIGCPVPGTRARLFLFDRMFTHFEKEEDATTLRGKLEDDLIRIHDALDRATDRSIVIMNEIFTSTSLQDALLLGGRILDRVIALDLLCVCVTFIDEWASLGPSTVSMTSMVDPDDTTRRTFKVVRRDADGLAHAVAIAHKYGLTYQQLSDRLGAGSGVSA
jgi:DNA mismatch repair protein MutS